VHDLTVASAASGYNLLVYLPTVDADGFDVISMIEWVFRSRRTSIPAGSRATFRRESEQQSERSDAGTMIVKESDRNGQEESAGIGVRGKGRR
jgi:hypothetical protein